MRERPGVRDITVSLEEKEARVSYAPEVLSCHQVAEAITGVAEKFTGRVISDCCTVEVRGMTCQSCVTNITNTVESLAGVSQCEVSLAAGRAEVVFDPDIVTATTLVETINQIGTKVSPIRPVSLSSLTTLLSPSSPPPCSLRRLCWRWRGWTPLSPPRRRREGRISTNVSCWCRP